MFDIFNFNQFFYYIFIILILSILFDVIYGELPLFIHPVVIIGKIANFFKSKYISINNRYSGFLLYISTVFVSCLIILFLFYLFSFNLFIETIFICYILTSTFSIRLLLDSAHDVELSLSKDINKARILISYLVSRDTNNFNLSQIVSATIETLSENITDSFVSPLFYFMFISLISILFFRFYFSDLIIFLIIIIPFIYRITNTLDAMVGYKTLELSNIGFFSAKCDDYLNFIPSRLASLFLISSAFLLGLDYKNSFRILRRDSYNCPSPNSGFTMAPTAGALNIQLVKPNVYKIGDFNSVLKTSHINQAIVLSKITIFLFTIFVILIIFFSYILIK